MKILKVETVLVIIAIVGMLLALGVGLYKGQTEPSYVDNCRASGGVPITTGGDYNCAKEGYIDLYK